MKINKYRLSAFIGCFVIFFVTELFWKDAEWLYDAQSYWTRGVALKESGFYLGAIDGFRGSIYPIYLGMVNLIGGRIAWYVVNALIISLFTSVMIPKFYNKGIEYSLSDMISTILFAIGIDIFFVGIIVYPLSDMISFIVFMGAILCFINVMKKERAELGWVILTGALCYMAYNIRTIYMFSSFGIIIMFFLHIALIKKDLKTKIINCMKNIVGYAIGVGIDAIPQICMNRINLGLTSIKVQTNGLMLSQLLWGIDTQRYDTYVPLFEDYVHDGPQIYFFDDVGKY